MFKIYINKEGKPVLVYTVLHDNSGCDFIEADDRLLIVDEISGELEQV